MRHAEDDAGDAFDAWVRTSVPQLERIARNNAKVRQWFRDLKLGLSCIRCGEADPAERALEELARASRVCTRAMLSALRSCSAAAHCVRRREYP